MPVQSRRGFLSLAAGCAVANFVPAAPAIAQQSSELDIKPLLQRGRLVVAMTEFDNPPFSMRSGSGVNGVDADLARQLGEALQLPVVFHRSSRSFNDVVSAVRDGQADVAFSKLSRTYSRTMTVAFSKPYASLRHAIVFNRLALARRMQGRDMVDVVRNFDGTMGVLENSSFATFATQRFTKARIVPFKTWDAVIDALLSNTLEAAYRDEFEIGKIEIERPATSIHLRTVTITDSRDFIAAAVPWGSRQLLAIVDQVIDNNPQAITPDYLIGQYKAYKKSLGANG